MEEKIWVAWRTILRCIAGERFRSCNIGSYKLDDIQNIAYDKLVMDCNEGEGYASLHLRDEIAHELYPEPCAARQRLHNLVWPRVVALIRADNRVTKSRKTVGGKSLEWFEWASDSSRKSRRSLAANGNNGDNTMKTTKVE